MADAARAYQPIVLNERQAGPAIEGVVRYNGSAERVRLSLLAVGTHGNSGMAIAKFSPASV